MSPAPTRAPPHSGGLFSIGNKMLAALVAVAILPAVTVSVYALRRTIDALSAQSLTSITEACNGDARRAEDLLDSVHQNLGEFARENGDLKRLLDRLMPGSQADLTGEAMPLDESTWGSIQRDLSAVEQKLRTLLVLQPSCRRIVLRSMAFRESDGTPILRLERAGTGISPRLVERDAHLLLRPVHSPPDGLEQRVLAAWNAAKEEHPERDVLRATLAAGGGEAAELFAARVRGNGRDAGDQGWVFVVQSWPMILQELRAGADLSASASVLASLYDDRQRPVASSRPELFAAIPDPFKADARAGQSNAALFESGEIVAIAPLVPRKEDPSAHYVLAFERPASELLENVHRFRVVFTSVLAAALLLAALFGTLLARRLTRPLRVLRDRAALIGQGDLAQTIDVRTGDEVEALAHEFNAMAAQLSSLYQGMEETIRERTEQLQAALDDLRRAHAEIVASERRYSDIVENASDLIQVTDAEGRIVAANRRQAELLELPVEALRGRDFLEFVAPDARDATRRAFAHVLAGNPLRAFESALLVGGGERLLPVEISANPVLDGDVPSGVRAILRDVSERKVIEARLIKAERLSSVGALAAGVAHEINNPLGIITMFAQRALERAKKGEIDVDKLEKIVEQGKRVASITRNLLDFARAAPTRFAPFEVGQVIESTCTLIADRARLSEIELRQEVSTAIPKVLGNAQQISQVLLNLLLNAFQAIGREGAVTVRAEVIAEGRLPTGGRAVRVSVEDSGPGIPPEVLPRLFEPFFTTKEPGEGTGLGLSVSYGILKEHHGAIFAGNRPEGGARFSFELPLEGAAEPTLAVPAARPDRAVPGSGKP